MCFHRRLAALVPVLSIVQSCSVFGALGCLSASFASLFMCHSTQRSLIEVCDALVALRPQVLL